MTATTPPASASACPPTDFGGPIGCLCTMIVLPILVLVLSHWANMGYLDLNWSSIVFSDAESGTLRMLGTDPMVVLQCFLGLVAWFSSLVVLWYIVPGPWVEGAPVIDPEVDYTSTKNAPPKQKLQYKLNGHTTFWIVILTVLTTQIPLNDYLYQYYDQLAGMDIVLCFGLSTYLYVTSFRSNTNRRTKKILSHTGRSGNRIYDYFMGRELNPRAFQTTFDWKQFCELRPGLFLWVLLNYACLQEQWKRSGTISGSMFLINLFHFIYVWDSVYNEKSILTTMDITTDGFGFMLIFGDLTWVPFTYNHPTKYLVQHDPHLSGCALAGIVVLYSVGYTIFRLANRQKDLFRQNPMDVRVQHLTYLQTHRGTRLLTSGWWGTARKINYTGDYLMGLSYSLLCGTSSIVPYYYSIYFLILLIHRSIRDDELCYEKYGPDWIEYKRLVPYRFLPGII